MAHILNYRQVRLRWCRTALIDLAKRWSVYLVLGASVLCAGSVSSTSAAAMAALAAWSVLPLFDAARHAGWIAPMACVVHALIGAVVVWGLKPVLWQPRWADVERALPISPGDEKRSDATAVTMALMPLFGLYAAGTAVWLVRFPTWFQAVWVKALIMLAASALLSLKLGIMVLQRMRRSDITPGTRTKRADAPAVATPALRATSPARALFALPLMRGPALRAGRFLALGSVALLAVDASLVPWCGDNAGWWLAGLSVLSLGLTTRLNTLMESDLAPLHAACLPLPLATAPLTRGRCALALLPVTIGLVGLAAAVHVGHIAVHPVAFAAYLSIGWIGNAMQVFVKVTKPSSQVIRWIFMLVLMIAIASEVGT